MSRREFRIAQETPRPASAVVMVGAATLTLAITGQVSPFALGIATLAMISRMSTTSNILPAGVRCPKMTSYVRCRAVMEARGSWGMRTPGGSSV